MSVPSRFFPHPPYAEDQPLSKLILSTHVLSRGFQTGALFGALTGTVRHIYTRPTTTTLLSALLRSSGVGGAIGIAFLAVGLEARMWGREHIEWQDRSWRLLENKGQVECDTFSAEGAIVGAGAVAWRQGFRQAGWRILVGGAGLGGLAGVVGYMGWRYGVKSGKWEDAALAVAEELNPAMPVDSGRDGIIKK